MERNDWCVWCAKSCRWKLPAALFFQCWSHRVTGVHLIKLIILRIAKGPPATMKRSARSAFRPDTKEWLKKRIHLENGFAGSILRRIREYIYTMGSRRMINQRILLFLICPLVIKTFSSAPTPLCDYGPNFFFSRSNIDSIRFKATDGTELCFLTSGWKVNAIA